MKSLKVRPFSTTFDFLDKTVDEARCITHEFESFVAVTTYSPCTGYDDAKMQARVKFDDDLRNHIVALRTNSGKPVVCCGDLNVNPRRQDWHEKAFASLSRVREAKGGEHHPGCTPTELRNYEALLRETGLSNAWESL